MAAQRSMWNRIGKFVGGLVIVCFFLPFFGVSCDGMDVITISGADMVGGCKPGGLIAAAEDEGQMQGGKLETKIDNVDVEPFAIAALVLVLVMFGLSFLASRSATRNALIAAVLSLGLLVALYIKINGAMGDAVEKEARSIKQGRMMSEVNVDAGGRFGLWGVGLGLFAVIGMTASALVRKPVAVPEVVTPPDAQPPTA